MHNEEARRTGAALREKLLGKGRAGAAAGPLADWQAMLDEQEAEHVWGTYWTRGGLAVRDRAICAITCLTALGFEDELHSYTSGLVRNGVLTREELREIIMHCASYIGYPKTLAARKVAQKVFAEEETGR